MNFLLESYCRIFEQILFSTLVEGGRRIYYRTFHDEHNIEAPTGSSGNILRLLINCISSNDSRSEETCCVFTSACSCHLCSTKGTSEEPPGSYLEPPSHWRSEPRLPQVRVRANVSACLSCEAAVWRRLGKGKHINCSSWKMKFKEILLVCFPEGTNFAITPKWSNLHLAAWVGRPGLYQLVNHCTTIVSVSDWEEQARHPCFC